MGIWVPQDSCICNDSDWSIVAWTWRVELLRSSWIWHNERALIDRPSREYELLASTCFKSRIWYNCRKGKSTFLHFQWLIVKDFLDFLLMLPFILLNFRGFEAPKCCSLVKAGLISHSNSAISFITSLSELLWDNSVTIRIHFDMWDSHRLIPEQSYTIHDHLI